MNRHPWVAVLLVFAASGLAPAQVAPVPVTPNASPEARRLLTALHRISGRNILSGQHNYVGTKSKFTEQAHFATGKWPAIWESDFGYAEKGNDDIHAREAMVIEAKKQFFDGSLIALTWHAVRPLEDEPSGLKESVQAKLMDEQWRELLSPGTPPRKRWEVQVDVIAGYLKQFRDARIPVLWRPYPEANGNSFWWSGRPGETGSAALYRQLFERLAVYHKLDNLVWVWDAEAPDPASPFEDYYPGASHCDILAASVHKGDYPQSLYDSIVKLAAGKPIALGEIDTVPTPDILVQQPLWTWFTVGAESLYRANKPAPVLALSVDPRTVHRGDPVLGPAALQTPEPAACEPANPNATPEARRLLQTICAVSGKFILSGQHNFPNHLSRHSENTAKVAARYPYLWGSDFGFTGGDDKDSIDGRDAMIEEAKRQYAAGSIITLMWHVVRPTDDEPVKPGIGWRGSVQNKLSDFEWNELLTPGTDLHRRWEGYIDTASGYLRRLQDAKIPVLWRPYHEANGNWFWWGGRKGENGFVALYRMTYDRIVNYHHLDNLIWVWNSNAPTGGNAGPYADFYPGPRYCDVLATDVYGEFKQSYHDDLVALADGRPIALGEIGRVPTTAVLKGQRKWTWFMIWADLLRMSKVELVQELLNDPHTLSRGDRLPDIK
jgi:mannan endo-1,4-beta-mannosidase